MCVSLDDPNERSSKPEPGHGHSSDIKARPSANMMDDITKLLQQGGGRFGLSFNNDPVTEEPWLAALEWGQEAPDSDMYGGAAYGLDEIPALAVEKCLREAGI